MNWGSPAEFFAMGGYALYVWGSFAMCAFALAVETILVIQRQKKLMLQLKNDSSQNRKLQNP